jgi:hypothetical protein
MDMRQVRVPEDGLSRVIARECSARISRARFIRRGAVAVGGLAGLGLLDGAPAFARETGEPRPIPGGFDQNFNPVPSDPLVHVLPPSVGFEMTTITDFNGVIGAAEIQGTASGSDGSAYTFDTDMRFMQGAYVGLDGRVYEGAFGFV